MLTAWPGPGITPPPTPYPSFPTTIEFDSDSAVAPVVNSEFGPGKASHSRPPEAVSVLLLATVRKSWSTVAAAWPPYASTRTYSPPPRAEVVAGSSALLVASRLFVKLSVLSVGAVVPSLLGSSLASTRRLAPPPSVDESFPVMLFRWIRKSLIPVGVRNVYSSANKPPPPWSLITARAPVAWFPVTVLSWTWFVPVPEVMSSSTPYTWIPPAAFFPVFAETVFPSTTIV